MDIVDKVTRSRYMAAVKGRGNKSTEVQMVSLLRSANIRGWRRHYHLPGTPDFCWPKERTVVFVDGCFWHGCSFCYKPPKSNVDYWVNKVAVNRARDKRVDNLLRKRSWVVIRIKECQISKARSIKRIIRALSASSKKGSRKPCP